MFVFDIETLSKNSNAVILSIGCVHFNEKEKPSFEHMKDNAFFVKLNASDQFKRLKRSYQQSTIDWWKKQCENSRTKSYKPASGDVIIEDGLEQFRTWTKQFNEPKSWVWARGTLDQLILDSMEDQLGIEPIFNYNRFRDVRTAVDFLYGTENGYCKVDYPGFDSFLNITKHDPVDDCLLDAMMLLYGVKKES
jgi:hypothetical protein